MIPISSPTISEDEIALVVEILKSGSLAQGKFVEEFEHSFSKVVDGLSCVAVNSGTSALHLSLLALGISKGDEVIVPAFTFAATANAVALTGATPIFVDVCPTTFNLDANLLESVITPRTKAIMPVHLYGQTPDLTAVLEIATKYGLLIIEDASQAHLAQHAGKSAGTFGDAAVFSFYATKNMTTGGEGGLIVTKSESVARKLRLLRNQGMQTRYQNEIVGFNLRMTEIQAGIGIIQLSKLGGWTQTRQSNAALMSSLLKYVQIPQVLPNNTHVFHQYTIRVPSFHRESLIQYLLEKKIGSAVYYPTPIHTLPAFQSKSNMPVSEILSAEVLSLPIHPKVSSVEIIDIAQCVNQFFEDL